MQNRYWNYMKEIKFDMFYLDLYAERSYMWNKLINIFTAVASSTSIAGWAMWQQHSFVWAIVIAASQVINAIKEWLPYRKRLKLIEMFIKNLSLLFNEIEYNWFIVASGDMTEEEINELLYHFKDEYTKMENEYMKGEILPDNKKFIEKVGRKTDSYFSKFGQY